MESIHKWSTAKICRLSNFQMRKVGFWDIAETRWLYYKHNNLLNLTFFFIIFKNKKNFKIKLKDNETKISYSINELYKAPWKNELEKNELNDFLNQIYQDFLNKGLIKGEIK